MNCRRVLVDSTRQGKRGAGHCLYVTATYSDSFCQTLGKGYGKDEMCELKLNY